LKTLKGPVTSSRLVKYGAQGKEYGFIGIEIAAHKHVQVKIDANTQWEKFKVGDRVTAEVEDLGSSGIIVAKKITLDHAGM
jgi:hypothetical protein